MENNFAAWFKRILSDRHKSQNGLSKELGVTFPTVNQWTKGALPYLDNWEILCDVLELSTDERITGARAIREDMLAQTERLASKFF